MEASAIPPKFSLAFGAAAAGGFIRPIPVASQIGIINGAASLTDGFPPLCFTPVGAGGVPPFGQDMNGILNQISEWSQWQAAGGPVAWDNAFSSAVGGYPEGAIVASATTSGQYWFSSTDNNATNPDTGGAGWIGFQPTNPAIAVGSATWGGTSGGAANAQTITLSAFSSAAQLIGVSIRWNPGANNTGSATIQVNAFAAWTMKKPSPSGLVVLTGNELAGPVEGFYDGTQFVLNSNYAGSIPVGTIAIASGSTADPGYLFCSGAAVSRATYASLFTKIGSAYGAGDGSTTFNVPDLRGRMPAGQDNMGGPAAGRITAAGGNFDGTVLGASGGQQSKVVAQTNLATMEFQVSDPTHNHSTQLPLTSNSLGSASGQSPSNGQQTYTSSNSATNVRIFSNGGNVPLPTLSNTQIVAYQIKY